ncbi:MULTISPECIES: PTS sugar transporter subunit IIB [Clostridium]|jgi:PTS system galactitol-specific IIB component|uniref:PTS system transporter subunit IIB n=3 Tax=Clostridium intestinale TaxID=36845 RepID=U2PYX0_9CLOT|nr:MULTISPECIES: PTS sugar transporter subunit IIB [Clostridium]ERK28979.1 PTS system transporter subunit IIB [Clostridium intestinale URNW]QLY80322.1 PTS sugar transporter subunit IIB [Clostridium intestinale]WRY50987.1 PTS sugar transporter subunit IIB [Clostridium intestinale]SHI47719.1 PTS system, galactitol-specific IIB component [Clostridium intestinale DSM 6191]
MKKFSVLSVCGSGTVTSSMIAEKLKDELEERGIYITTKEARPTEAYNLVSGGGFDFITHTSPLPEADYGIPTINAVGFLTGFGEEEFLDEVMAVIEKLSKK